MMLKSIVVLSIGFSSFYIGNMFINKKEIFLSLIQEFQKLKNLEAQHPELKADFNAIAKADEVQKIADLLAKQQAKIMAKEAAVGAVQSETMMEEENREDKVKNAEILRSIFNEWYIPQYTSLSGLSNNQKIISTKALKHIIDNHHSNNIIVKNSALLTEMYSNLSNAINSTEMSVDDISKKFVEVLNKYSFIQKGSMKAWFNKNEEFYKATAIVNFQTGTFLNLAGAIGEAEEAAKAVKINNSDFIKWLNQNVNSISSMIDTGYVSLATLHEKISKLYSKNMDCDFIANYLLYGIDSSITKINILSVRRRLLINLNILEKTITDEEKDNVCTKIDSTYKEANTLGGLIKASINNNLVDSTAFKKLIEESIKAAKSQIKVEGKNEEPIVDIKGFLSDAVRSLNAIEDVWVHGVIIDCIKPFSLDNRDYIYYSECAEMFSKKMDTILHAIDDYHESCPSMPKVIPFDSIANFLKTNIFKINTHQILDIHGKWYIDLGISKMSFNDNTKLHKLTLIRTLSDAFSQQPAEINLPYQWLDKYILSELAKHEGNTITWEAVKGIFKDTLSHEFLKEYLNNLVKNNSINEVAFILKYWVNYLPSKATITSAFQAAINALSPKAIAISNLDGKFHFVSNSKLGLSFDIDFKMDKSIKGKTIVDKLKNIKTEVQVDGIVVKNINGIELEFDASNTKTSTFNINEVGLRREEYITICFNYKQTITKATAKTPWTWGLEAGVGGDVVGAGASFSSGSTTTSEEINSYIQGKFYITLILFIDINDKDEVFLNRSAFFSVFGKLLERRLDINSFGIEIKQKKVE